MARCAAATSRSRCWTPLGRTRSCGGSWPTPGRSSGTVPHSTRSAGSWPSRHWSSPTMGWYGRLAVAPRRLVPSRLAGWLRRLSVRVARAAATLERPAPDTVALEDSGVLDGPGVPNRPGVPDGPPEHWLRVVAERAPELLEGRGVRGGTAIPPPAGSMPPMPNVARAEALPDRSPAGRSAPRSGDWGDVQATHRPAPLQASVPHGSAPVDRVTRPARGAVEAAPYRRPPPDPWRSEPGTRRVSTVDPPEPHAPERGAVSSPSLRRVLARLVPSRFSRRRRPAEPGTVERPRLTGTAQTPPVTRPASPAAAVPAAPIAVAPGRTLGWPVDDLHHRTTAPMPDPAAPVDLADPGLWGGFDPVPVRRGGDRRPAGPPVRALSTPAPGDVGTRWPAPPSGGPWPWAKRRPADLWPALPDDSSLWTPPSTVFTDARVRRLDDEQRGA